MNTNSTKINYASLIYVSIILLISLLFFCPSTVFANSKLPLEKINDFSANSIYFYQPCDDKNDNNSISSICGDTAKEKYWSALKIVGFNDKQIAGIFGSISHEGAFGPTKWQYNISTNGAFNEGYSWEGLYKGTNEGGIGAFQNTTWMTEYLHDLEKDNPDLLKYYKDPSYSFDGDVALKKIGEKDFDRLVEQDVNLFTLKYKKDATNYIQANLQSIEEVNDYWTRNVENCACCGGNYANEHNNGCATEIPQRLEAALKAYDEIKEFACTGPPKSDPDVSKYTLLDGYGSLTFYGPDAASNGGYAGKNATDSINGGNLADGQVAKDTRDKGQLKFNDVIYIETTSNPNAESSYANGKFFIVADTGGETARTSKWDIDVFVNQPNPSALNSPPYGSTTNAKVYKVASNVSWNDYLTKYHNSNGASNKSNNSSNNSSKSITGEKITWIGDSYSVAANNKGLISNKYPGVDLGSGSPNTSSSNIQVGKFVSSGNNNNPSCLTILQNLINANKLRPYLVFACGTNGGWSNDDITKFKNLLSGKSTKAIIVNSKTPNNDYNDSNERLKTMANSSKNIYLADWASVYDASYFNADPEKIHPASDPGYEKWVESIFKTLNSTTISCANAAYDGDYPQYLQCDERWGSLDYKGCSMCKCSCGASSVAMLATAATGENIYPNDIANLLGDSVYYETTGAGMADLDKIVGEKYGFEVQSISYDSLIEAEEKMKEKLDEGYMLHFSGAGSYPFSSGGHYIGVFGWSGEGDKVMVANSAFNGNDEISLHSIITAGVHGGAFSAIKGNCKSNSNDECPDNDQRSSNTNTNSNNNNVVLNAVKEIIELANKNGSTYEWGGGHAGNQAVFDSMLNGAPINVDCTGFASLVMYKAYNKITSFSSSSIFSDSMFQEVSRNDVRPGDIFTYNVPEGHGGIVIEVENGVVTRIAEAGVGQEGKSGNNTNIGYSSTSDQSVKNVNSENGHFFRLKGV